MEPSGGWGGWGVYGFSPDDGSLSQTSFAVDGTTYTIEVVGQFEWRLYTLQSKERPRASGMDWRQVWRWLREIEWAGSLARQLWGVVTVAVVLGLAAMRTLWEDPFRLTVVIIASALLVASIVNLWFGYRRLRKDAAAEPPREDKEEDKENEGIVRGKAQTRERARQLEHRAAARIEQSEELAKCREKYKNLQYEHGRWWIDRCGIDGEYRNRSVIVQFIALGDRALAEDAKELFSMAWRVKDIEHIQWKRNTCSSHRIVIFSNDEAAPGLRHAINEYNLLGGEQVGRMEKRSEMEDDVTIIIFPESDHATSC